MQFCLTGGEMMIMKEKKMFMIKKEFVTMYKE